VLIIKHLKHNKTRYKPSFDLLHGKSLLKGAEGAREGQGGAVGGGGIARGGLAGMGFGLAVKGRPGEDGLGPVPAAGNDDASQMDLPPDG
jgi:hypothetical protein